MQKKELENEIDFLLSAAIKKCGNAYDAEDIVQETVLSALAYLKRGNKINDMRGWLLTVLNRKYYDLLRKQYRQPITHIADGFDIIDERDELAGICATDEGERVRKAISRLASVRREVIVRHYMHGESVCDIARALDIPEGTVKSRLHSGREQMKKGIEAMEKYSAQSYAPIRLMLNNSGSVGRDFEPYSLVRNDLIAENLLWLAYKNPLAVEELSDAVGIASAYIEPIIKKLTDGELMKKVGNKYYTDFLIETIEDIERYTEVQKRFVHDNFDLFWQRIEAALAEIREKAYYKRQNGDQKESMELYATFRCLDYGIFGALERAVGESQKIPERPNGGAWIAFGRVDFKPFDPTEHIPYMSHRYSGERWEEFRDMYGAKSFMLSLYGADGFPSYRYDRSPDYTFSREGMSVDAVFLKLFYIIHEGIDPNSVGFNTEIFKAVPQLTKCRILREENGKTVLNIPAIDKNEFYDLREITARAITAMQDELTDALAEYCRDKRNPIPEHLQSIPLIKQYWNSANAMLFAAIREAMKRGYLRDGDYDREENQHPAPMILTVDK